MGAATTHVSVDNHLEWLSLLASTDTGRQRVINYSRLRVISTIFKDIIVTTNIIIAMNIITMMDIAACFC